MDERAGVMKKLEQVVGKLPDDIREDLKLQERIEDYLHEKNDWERENAWEILVEEAERLKGIAERAEARGRAKALEGVKVGPSGGDMAVRAATLREDGRKGGKVEPEWFVGPTTTAMVQAMSELFAGWAHQYREVVTFRDKGLGGRLLTENEAHEFLASYATRILTYQKFLDWEIPIIGHTSKLVEYDPGLDKDEIDHRATLQIDPPGITKTVRYAYPSEGDSNTMWKRQDKVLVPPNQRGPLLMGEMPIEVISEELKYPPFLWPNSLVDNLYDIAEKLTEALDWPDRDAAAWFILTGKAPEVRPIEARWETKQGTHSSPQWRIRLTIPPWLPEKEVLRAYRLLRRQISGGKKLPKTPTTLEVFRFVCEQERQEGYKKLRWDTLREQWNKEHPGYPFETYRMFRNYFTRGKEAVRDLNFSWPLPPKIEPEDE